MRVLFSILVIFSSVATFAGGLALIQNARTFDAHHESLVVKSLAFACMGLEIVPDQLPCNPAMTTKAKKGSLSVEGLMSNGYSNFSKVHRLLTGEVNQALVNELFSNERVLQLESNVDLMFTSPFINSIYSPTSNRFFSVIRNDANPDVDLMAVEEKLLAFQVGYSSGPWDFGVELRKVDWNFIKQRFKLLSLSTQQGLNAIKAKSQSAIFAQPGVNYNFGSEWKPRVSIQAVNLGWLDHEYSEFTHKPELQVGFGVTPSVSEGILQVLVDYKSLSPEDQDSDKLHFGILFTYGAMNLGLGLDNKGSSFGVFYVLEKINAGILYSSTQVPWNQTDYFAQTVYLQVGWQL